jgi:hypothetical protein
MVERRIITSLLAVLIGHLVGSLQSIETGHIRDWDGMGKSARQEETDNDR